MSGGPPGDDTRTRLLDEAEALFATKGFEGTSLRAVTRAAGANLAAVNYHFGSKAGLFEAVLARLTAPINSARLAALDALEARDDPPQVGELLRVFVGEPVRHFAAHGPRARAMMTLMARVRTAGDPELERMVRAGFREVFTRFHAAFGRALPGLDSGEITFRMLALVGIFKSTLMARQVGPPGPALPPDPDLESLISRIVAFAEPGFRRGAEAAADGR